MITRPIQNVNSISNSSMGYTPLPQYNHRFGITQHHTLSKCSRKYPLIYIDSEVKSDSKFDHLMKEVGVDVSSDMRKVISITIPSLICVMQGYF